MQIDRRLGLRRALRHRRRRRCASRARACASTASICASRAGRLPARPSSAGTAPTRSTPTAAASRSRASRSPAFPIAAAHRPARLLGHGQRHLRRSALQRPRPRRRSVRGRGRARPAERPHRGPRRRAQHRPARGRVAAPGGVGRRAHHALADARRRPHAALLAHLDRSLRPPPRAAALAVHDRGCERRRSASSGRCATSSRLSVAGRHRRRRSARCSTTGCRNDGPIRLVAQGRRRPHRAAARWSAKGRRSSSSATSRLTEDRLRVRALGDANLEPAPGLLPRHPLVGLGRGPGRNHRLVEGAGDHRQRGADQRPPALLRPAALDRRRQRPGRVRRRRRAASTGWPAGWAAARSASAGASACARARSRATT